MKKTKKQKLYMIPGWGETVKFKQSRELINWASDKYEVVPIRYISKKGVLPSENLKIIRDQIKRPTNRSVIFGFSMGALFAYILASEIKFEKAIICSISPILENDLDFYTLKDVHKLFTDREIKELKTLKYKKLKCPAVVQRVCAKISINYNNIIYINLMKIKATEFPPAEKLLLLLSFCFVGIILCNFFLL